MDDSILKRFGVSMDEQLLKKFDELVKIRGLRKSIRSRS